MHEQHLQIYPCEVGTERPSHDVVGSQNGKRRRQRKRHFKI